MGVFGGGPVINHYITIIGFYLLYIRIRVIIRGKEENKTAEMRGTSGGALQKPGIMDFLIVKINDPQEKETRNVQEK